MSISRSTLALAVLCAALASTDADAKKKPKPPRVLPCAGARFVVEGPRLLGDLPLADAVVIGASDLVVESCTATGTAKSKVGKKKATVTAMWKACPGAAGPVRMKLSVDPNACATIAGTLKAKKAKPRRFTARRSGPPAIGAGPLTTVALAGGAVGPGGGSVWAPTDGPLAGLAITVPPGATDEPITFTAEVADVTGIDGLPTGSVPSSRLIRITATGSDDWNQYRTFDKPVLVTLPYLEPGEAEESVRFYMVNGDGTLEPAGMEGQDAGANTVSFYTRAFGDVAEPSRLGRARRAAREGASSTYASYVAVGLRAVILSALLDATFTMDSGFRPTVDGWHIPNFGSYYKKTRGGSCFGFVTSARYYHRRGFAPDLFQNYWDANRTPTWVDDATAIQFAARVQAALGEMWSTFTSQELNLQQPSSRAVALSYIGGLYVTAEPVLLYIQQAVPQGATTVYSGAHAIMIYRVDVGGGVWTFHVYDPNFPGKEDRRLVYRAPTGFETYASGTDATTSNYLYNFFKHVGFHVGVSDATLDGIKAAADANFEGSSVFPVVLVTEVRNGVSGEPAEEGTTERGEHKFVVKDNLVRVKGTILGGLAQDACCVVNSAEVYLSSQQFSTAVNNAAGGGDGSFDLTMPILSGENELVIIGSAAGKPWRHWAGFHRDVIESTYAPAALTVTLTWDADASDVDLYVQEPDGPAGQVGDTVYYAHRRGRSDANPYLDLDDTSGLGPEHFIAVPGMSSKYTDGTPSGSLYGTYRARVHYYADHDSDDERDQPIGWSVHWRELAFCPPPCADPESEGFWVEGSDGGVIGTASSGACCNIGNGGPSWDAPITISYPAPDPAAWGIPDPPAVMLP